MMRLIIVLIGCLLITLGFIDCIFIYKNVRIENTRLTLFFIILLTLPILGIYYLSRFHNKRTENSPKIRTSEIGRYTFPVNDKAEPYELRPSISFYASQAFIFVALGILPLAIGIKLLSENIDTTKLFIPASLVLLGLFFSGISLFGITKLIGKPFIRIDINGIQHYMMDLIQWKDITEVYLQTISLKSTKHYSLVVFVKNPQHYQTKDRSLFKNICKNEKFSLILPVSGKKAKIVEAVSKAFINHMNVPSLDSKLAKFLMNTDESILLGKNVSGNWTEEKARQWFDKNDEVLSETKEISAMLDHRLNNIIKDNQGTLKSLRIVKVIAYAYIVFWVYYIIFLVFHHM